MTYVHERRLHSKPTILITTSLDSDCAELQKLKIRQLNHLKFQKYSRPGTWVLPHHCKNPSGARAVLRDLWLDVLRQRLPRHVRAYMCFETSYTEWAIFTMRKSGCIMAAACPFWQSCIREAQKRFRYCARVQKYYTNIRPWQKRHAAAIIPPPPRLVNMAHFRFTWHANDHHSFKKSRSLVKTTILSTRKAKKDESFPSCTHGKPVVVLQFDGGGWNFGLLQGQLRKDPTVSKILEANKWNLWHKSEEKNVTLKSDKGWAE